MARHVGRSRGCRNCRQRKIKCDEQTPDCSQCQRHGRKCPGPLTGPLIIDMSKGKAQAATRDVTLAEIRGQQETGGPASGCEPFVRGGLVEESRPAVITSNEARKDDELKNVTDSGDAAVIVSQRNQRVVKLLQLPEFYQPCRAAPIEELFLGHFIDFFFIGGSMMRDNENAWAFELPNFLAASSSPAVRISFRAAAMALYSHVAGDRAVEIESCRWYDRALKMQRWRIGTVAHSGIDELDHSTLYATLLLGYFEAVMKNNYRAWMRHAIAAEWLLEMVGPRKCQEGQFHSVFRLIRKRSAFLAFIIDRPSIFASDDWRLIPFEGREKSPYDGLLDLGLQVPHCLKTWKEMCELTSRDTAAFEIAKDELKARCCKLLSQSDEYWAAYKHQTGSYCDQSTWSELRDAGLKGLETQTVSQEINSAVIFVQYISVKIILNSLLASLLPNSDVFKKEMILHSAFALAAVRYHERNVIAHSFGDTFYMIFSLQVVKKASPSAAQRQEAREMLNVLRECGVKDAIGFKTFFTLLNAVQI